MKIRFTNNNNFSLSILFVSLQRKNPYFVGGNINRAAPYTEKLNALEASMKAMVSNSNQLELVETVAETSFDLQAKSIQEMQSIEKALESTEIF